MSGGADEVDEDVHRRYLADLALKVLDNLLNICPCNVVEVASSQNRSFGIHSGSSSAQDTNTLVFLP